MFATLPIPMDVTSIYPLQHKSPNAWSGVIPALPVYVTLYSDSSLPGTQMAGTTTHGLLQVRSKVFRDHVG